MKKLFLLIPFLFVGQIILTAQKNESLSYKERTDLSKKSIKELREGVLIVRLKTGKNQINALNRMINSKSLAPDVKKVYKERKENMLVANREHNLAIISAFNEKYKFSDVLFMPDTCVHLLNAGQKSGYFLNKELIFDDTISLGNKNYFIAFHGTPNTTTKSGVEGLVILDKNMNELADPFPFFTGRTTIRKTFSNFLNKTDNKDHYAPTVEKMNKRLHVFYRKNGGFGY